jgi:cytoskeletal protein RodZ
MGGGMATVAEQLRSARAALKLDVYQVAEITKIRTDHIRALEAGDYNQFVAPVYIRGFVRTYAGLLKLDVPQIIKDLNAELGQTDKFAEPPALTKQPKSWLDALMLQLCRVDWRVLVGVVAALVLLALGIVGYSLAHTRRTTDPLRHLGAPTYQPRTAGSNDTLPLPRPPGK